MLNHLRPRDLTSPTCVDAAGNDWTSEEARARRELKAWMRENRSPREDLKVRELHFGAEGNVLVGDENSPDLDEVAWKNMGDEVNPGFDFQMSFDQVVVGDGFEMEELLDAAQAQHQMEREVWDYVGELMDNLISTDKTTFQTARKILEDWLVNDQGLPLGENGLALLVTVVRDAKAIGLDYRSWPMRLKLVEIMAMAQAIATARSENDRKAAEAKRAQAVEEARRQAEESLAWRQHRNPDAKPTSKPTTKSAPAQTTPAPKADWMGRVDGFFHCTSRGCKAKGDDKCMMVGSLGAMRRRQDGVSVEVFDLHKHCLCPSCVARIQTSMPEVSFRPIAHAVAEIEELEQKLPGNNVLSRSPGMTESMRPSRFCVEVNWANDSSWKDLLFRDRKTPAQWDALRESLGLGSLDLSKIEKKLIPVWECEGRSDVINWRQLRNIELDQRARQGQQHQREAHKHAKERRGQGQSHEAPWMR